ncbi:MobQ family relaxase [Granulicella aggregans]|uniref:MobQ family relaxase n=1 Tax=Granulicella aggregans TaxID=474949 RepID=UPI0021DFEE8D|nr:MobQ family relaxase [Granulicella aggregans]
MTTASWYHSTMKTISRSAGRSVVAAAAYRMGECFHDELHDIVHDYTRKSGVEAAFTVAPVDAPEWVHDPEALWNAAEQAETRKNSTVGREIELALPSLLSLPDRQRIVERFAGELVDRYGVAVSVALHAPSRDGDDRNYHAHILFTTREVTPSGMGKKTRILDDRSTGRKEVVKLRELAADFINEALAAVNSDLRVDHRSFEERGIEREGTIHLGPKASGQERRGEATRAGDYNRHVEQYNALLAERRELETAISQERERITSPAQDQPTAQERVRAAAAPFIGAIEAHGAVPEIHADGFTWWQRAAGRIAQARDAALGLAVKAAEYWRRRAQEPGELAREIGELER